MELCEFSRCLLNFTSVQQERVHNGTKYCFNEILNDSCVYFVTEELIAANTNLFSSYAQGMAKAA